MSDASADGLAPTIETERLRLRPIRFDDWPAAERFMASERAAHIGGPFDRAAAWGWFCHDRACWSFFGYGSLAIEERSSGDLLGQISLNGGPFFPEPELGWTLFTKAEGFGYATEAARAQRAWFFDHHPTASLVSYVDPDNHRSRRVAERLGARLDPDAARPEPDDVVYRHR